eukprot:3125193-Pyramimonas_sp.AAC.1
MGAAATLTKRPHPPPNLPTSSFSYCPRPAMAVSQHFHASRRITHDREGMWEPITGGKRAYS